MKIVRLACVLATVAGCGASVTTGTAELTGATFAPVGGAANTIRLAECARAQACGVVPSRGVYRDADFCETDLRRKIDDDLLSGNCRWVDAGRLDVCLDAVRAESCATMEIAERPPPPCRHASLCESP